MIKFKIEAYVFISLFNILLISCSNNKKNNNLAVETTNTTTQLQEYYNEHSQLCIDALFQFQNSNEIDSLEHYYLNARKEFKFLEPLLAFVDSENYKFLNQPNILKVEEEDLTDIKINNPTGFQVLEEELFTDNPDLEAVKNHAAKTAKRLQLIQKNLNLKYLVTDNSILWIVRDQIIRTALLGITGFDSPLENSLSEAKFTYYSLQNILFIYKVNFNNESLYETWISELNNAIQSLNGSFTEFNRFEFIKNHTNKEFEIWNQTVKDWNIDFPYERAFRNDITSLFSKETFNMDHFALEKKKYDLEEEKIELGKKLFFDPSLSSSKTISCSNCHQPDKAYTDGLVISKAQTRNSPTLLYAGLQKGFFYDNRSGSLEGQIISVIDNENEFHTDLEGLENSVKENANYLEAFEKIYKNQPTQEYIRNAIASFIKSLSPFDSKFDRNINDLENTLTSSEINGFNLFMGKAKCATCHFPPTFNGTVPIQYKESEMELIGVPKNNDSINAEIDDDLGRYNVFKTSERKHFFKTPTVRNIEKTAPYMHNGVYKTLDEVIEFYNKGGGIGLGMDLEYQTLPSDPLNLSKKEINDIISFLNSLSDNSSSY